MNIPRWQQPSPALDTFSTERLPLAIYLHASQRMPFVGCERVPNGKLKLLFQDEENQGAQAELEFFLDRGAVVPASELFASQKYLRRRMSEALNDRRLDNRKNENQP